MGVTIAISNQKGGVAKTTTCISLGAALAEMGKTVLLIDLDPQANLTLSFKTRQPSRSRAERGLGGRSGYRPGSPGTRGEASSPGGIMDALTGNDSLMAVSQQTGIAGLHVAPGGRELIVVDKVFYQLPGYQYRLREALEGMEPGLYDYVLLDCPPSLATLTLNALAAADLLIIPVQCELYAAHSVGQMVHLVRQVREQCNPDLQYRVLITMYDMRNRISQMILDQMQQSKADVLFKTIIQIDTKLRESPAYGKPITSYAPESRAAQQYKALAQELDPDVEALLRAKDARLEASVPVTAQHPQPNPCDLQTQPR